MVPCLVLARCAGCSNLPDHAERLKVSCDVPDHARNARLRLPQRKTHERLTFLFRASTKSSGKSNRT